MRWNRRRIIKGDDLIVVENGKQKKFKKQIKTSNENYYWVKSKWDGTLLVKESDLFEYLKFLADKDDKHIKIRKFK